VIAVSVIFTLMIKAKHNPFYIWFFHRFFQFKESLNFRKTTFFRDFDIPEDQSVLLLQNHFSWWDGFWSYRVSSEIFRRKFHVMMLEDQLKKRLFLSKCGVFSIQKNNRDFLNSLAYTAELLRNPDNLVTIYPTGVMQTQHQQTHHFLQGISRLIKDSSSQFSIVMAVILVDYFGFAKPEIRIYLGKYQGERNPESIENAYHLFYQSCIDRQTE